MPVVAVVCAKGKCLWRVRIWRNDRCEVIYHHQGEDIVQHILEHYPDAEIEFED